jgi:hypothetical protein
LTDPNSVLADVLADLVKVQDEFGKHYLAGVTIPEA